VQRTWLEQVYVDLFHRDVDPSGAVTWPALLAQSNSYTFTALVILTSTPQYEFYNDQVEGLYQQLLKRPADPQGLSMDVTFLVGGGTLEQVAAGIVASPEYFQDNGGNNTSWLAAVYQDVLHRPIDPTGSASWSNALAQGLTLAQAALAIYSSPEYQMDLVEGYYQTYLHRTADAAGLNAWVAALAQGMRDEQAIAGFLGSAEYLADVP